MTDKSHIRLSYVTHFYLNQNDVSSIMNLLRTYETYDASLLDRIQFVIVDDGSPLQYDIPEFNLNMIWLKITDDITWNQAGARNLGVVYAKSDKILMVDLDHIFPEDTLHHMVQRLECGRDCYRIYRTDLETGQIKKKHPNTFLMSRARFLRFYGYDEEFAGHYGAEDYRFVKVQKYHGTRFLYLPKKYRCRERDDIDHRKSYHSLERDLTHNTPIDTRKKEELLAYGPDSGYSRIFLNFKWEIVKDYAREKVGRRKEKKWWKHLWYWRWLVGYR
jgi:hypothetical protein